MGYGVGKEAEEGRGDPWKFVREDRLDMRVSMEGGLFIG